MMKYMLLATAVVGLLGLGILTPRGEVIVSQERPFVVQVPQDFPTIQAAIDAVAEGGTVLIGPGLYKENVQITKSIRLVGASQELVRVQAVDHQKPIFYVTSKAPIQIDLQGLTLFREQVPDIQQPFAFILPGAGVFIIGPIQTIMRRLTITNSTSAVVVFPLAEADGSLLHFQPSTVLEEVELVRNGGAVLSGSAQVTIVRSTIAENEGGVFSDNLYLAHSTVRQNRFWGVQVSLSTYEYGPRYMGALDDNNISENGVGVILGAPSEDAAGSWLWMNGNKITQNKEYGVMILKQECQTSFTHPELALGKESAFIKILGGNNEVKENGKADLCPPDYPWPPGFRK